MGAVPEPVAVSWPRVENAIIEKRQRESQFSEHHLGNRRAVPLHLEGQFIEAIAECNGIQEAQQEVLRIDQSVGIQYVTQSDCCRSW